MDKLNITRERLLLIAAGIVLLIVAVPVLRSLYTESQTLQKQRQKLQDDIAKYQREAEKKTETKARLTDLTSQSLPSKEEMALSQYQSYLMRLATETGIKEYRSDTPAVSKQKNNLYSKFSFTIHGKGTLQQTAEFLRRFHKTPYLHLIRSVSSRATRKPDEFEITFKVEALSLPQNKELPELNAQTFAVSDAEKQLLKAITDRAVFSEYRPPEPQPQRVQEPVRETIADFDSSPYCYLTTIVETDGKYQCWVNNRIENKTYKLFEGEMFRLGGVRCSVKKINFDRVQFEAARELYIVRIGKSFAEFE
ncbi:MAG: hypothetical protein LBT89_00380 [Planctomycetaceae bacterium]|jgi:uncharacterized membrane-anchored protein YhcB (DUF1043 family)|nr:hypothetical protein [Planctomycetaceae bacterium]